MKDMASRSATVRSPSTTTSSYAEYVNPERGNLLDILDMSGEYERWGGAELFTRDGRRTLDFLSGHCQHNAGHNHPIIVKALNDELDKSAPAMQQASSQGCWGSGSVLREGGKSASH